MVIKISKTSSVEGVVEYNTRKVEEGKAKILSSSLISSKSDAELTRDDIVTGFQARIAQNHRTRNTMTHISVNPDPKEALSDDLLTKIAEDFLEQLGYGEQPYIVVKHEDIDREHVHIVVCNIDAQGQKVNDAFEKKRSNDIRKGLETKYQLLKAEEQRTNRRYVVQKADEAKGNHFAQIRDIGGALVSEYAYGSVNEYRTLLEAHNIVAHTVGDAKSGTAELLYGIGQEDFVAPPIPGKQFAEIGMTYKDVALRAAENADIIKRHCASPKLKQVMQGLMALDSLNELRKQSGRLGLSIQFRQAEDGRVYGATVIDYKKKVVFKASALGREFSARHWQ
ncbi:MAG: relaxase/mobilization nuclease domain-containing protein, partial [Bacteroidales bacterium]|nr:relaxase/mobilization nuclease domain-containing protein [Bacteroidales bacterium]